VSSYGVVLFYTTSSALRAEKVLAREGLAVKLIPTPRHLSSDCGIALRFDRASFNQVQNMLGSAGVEIAGIHDLAQ
jgi:hypothetical protein